ncbi:hypothetical protein [Alloactinosynnema sp. L-07]|uniref:hypothetical protein n=1 Tax=Alloactinosynnema sp. L-07 TaxID=1653480 RepID=UPI00065F0935|nr:hypothetical protein [Alloactinosynnema sp. L-07]CRK55423.1 hypothetical protein [Alloactinosynnema sp. L-07]
MVSVSRAVGAFLVAVGAPLVTAAPALADTPAPNIGGVLDAANIGNFTPAATGLQEMAVVPVLGKWVGNNLNNLSNGNVIDHSR